MPQDAQSGQRSVGQAVLKFLRSVGKPSEAELYLALFRGLPRGRFALLAPTDAVLSEASGIVAEQLAFLRELGLFPSVVLGATEAAHPQLEGYLMTALSEAGVEAELVPWRAGESMQAAEQVFARAHLPVLRCEGDDEQRLALLAALMQPRKVIVLKSDGGLGPHEHGRLELSPGHVLLTRQSGVFAINLRSDLQALLAQSVLTEDDAVWLERARLLLQGTAQYGLSSTTVSFASPLSLLRELFTVRGEGTLVKLGSVVVRCDSYATADRARIEHLLLESFERAVRPEFWARVPVRFYLEQDYRGLALLERGVEGATYLSKFAVTPVARGEGLGQDLWWEMRKDTRLFYWRSRADNPINGFYLSACDGMQTVGGWMVFWCGASPELIPALIMDAVQRPADLVSR